MKEKTSFNRWKPRAEQSHVKEPAAQTVQGLDGGIESTSYLFIAKG